VVGEECDIVIVRTNHPGETVYLYRLNTSAENGRQRLLVYLDRNDMLADRPARSTGLICTGIGSFEAHSRTNGVIVGFPA
jgi:hypothetical protein